VQLSIRIHNDTSRTRPVKVERGSESNHTARLHQLGLRYIHNKEGEKQEPKQVGKHTTEMKQQQPEFLIKRDGGGLDRLLPLRSSIRAL